MILSLSGQAMDHSGHDNKRTLDYFLGTSDYDGRVPAPEEFFGFQPGEWHLQHALLVQYMERLAESSARVIIEEYGRTWEFRPLVQLIITSEENHARLDQIREEHLKLSDPSLSEDLELARMPAVVRLGYGVHGNEPSAHNAAPLVAYHLAASLHEEVRQMLDDLIIIIDPSMNPDGQDRYASWVNRHRSVSANPDPNGREFRDVWPGSRSNHYWFDLNRDWLAVQQPESKARAVVYHQWMPNVNTDHHEFGPNNTFFFQPGEPMRVNPRIPAQTDELTREVAMYHAAAFDAIGQRYYMQQGFDDYYMGKGSTYPDLQGAVGILFEQASSRGQQVETIHGVLDFSETIRNQVLVSFSSLRAAVNMRQTLLEHMRWFFSSALAEARGESIVAYVFGDRYDQGRNYHLLDILYTHGIEVYALQEDMAGGGETFQAGTSWLVPLHQPQYRLIRSVFDKVLEFNDSIFYDVSTWTKPLVFNIPYAGIFSARQLNQLKGERVKDPAMPTGRLQGNKSQVAYLFRWDEYYAPRALYHLQKMGLRTHVATQPFTTVVDGALQAFPVGTVLVPVKTQELAAGRLFDIIQQAGKLGGMDVYSAESSLVTEGVHLGSGSFAALEKPRVAMLVGRGINSREAGEVWHLLDTRYHMPLTKLETDHFSSADISRYNTLVMVSGSYNVFTERDREKLDQWVRAGGRLVAVGTANRWLAQQQLAEIDFVELPEPEEAAMLPYAQMRDHRGARRISGSLFQAKIDVTHPIFYGYRRDILTVHAGGTLAANPGENPFANPMLFTEDALVSGYAWEAYKNLRDHTAGVLIHRSGRGRIISFMDNPNFRGYCFGSNKMFGNAIFFGPIIAL